MVAGKDFDELSRDPHDALLQRCRSRSTTRRARGAGASSSSACCHSPDVVSRRRRRPLSAASRRVYLERLRRSTVPDRPRSVAVPIYAGACCLANADDSPVGRTITSAIAAAARKRRVVLILTASESDMPSESRQNNLCFPGSCHAQLHRAVSSNRFTRAAWLRDRSPSRPSA